MVFFSVSLCMAFGVVALNIALYLHNLATPTRADSLLVWVKCRKLTSLCFPLSSPIYNRIVVTFPLHTLRDKSDILQMPLHLGHLLWNLVFTKQIHLCEIRRKNEHQGVGQLFCCLDSFLASISKIFGIFQRHLWLDPRVQSWTSWVSKNMVPVLPSQVPAPSSPYGERYPSGFLTTVSLAIWFWEVPRTAPQLTVCASSFSWNSARHLIMATNPFLLKLMHSLVCNWTLIDGSPMTNYWQSGDQNPDLCSFFYSVLLESLSWLRSSKKKELKVPCSILGTCTGNEMFVFLCHFLCPLSHTCCHHYVGWFNHYSGAKYCGYFPGSTVVTTMRIFFCSALWLQLN